MATNIGNINFGIEANTKGLQNAIKKISQFQKVVDQAAKSQTASAKKTAAALSNQEKAIRSALRETLNLRKAMMKAGAPRAQLATLTQQFQVLVTQLTKGQITVVQFNRAMQDFKDKMNTSQRELARFNSTAASGASGVKKYAVILRDLESSAVLALGPLSGLGARIRSIGAIIGRGTGGLSKMFLAATAAVVGTTIAMTKLISIALRAGSQMQSLQLRFEAATGSTEASKEALRDTFAIAKRLGLEVTTLAKSYSRFTAATQGTALEGQRGAKIFEQFAMAAAALKLEGTEVEGVMRALEQMMSKGTIQAEELRGQLGDRLPGAFRIFSEALGVSTQELNRMLKAGEVLAGDTLVKAGEKLETLYGEKAQENVKTLSGAINVLKTTWFEFGIAANKLPGGLAELATLNMTESKLTFTDMGRYSVNILTSMLNAVTPVNEELQAQKKAVEELSEEWQRALRIMENSEAAERLTKIYSEANDDINEQVDALIAAGSALKQYNEQGGDIETLAEKFKFMQEYVSLSGYELLQLSQKLEQLLGFPVAPTLDAVAAAFAQLEEQARKAANSIDVITETEEGLREFRRELELLRLEADALAKGDEAADLFDAVTSKVEAQRDAMADWNISAEERAKLLKEYEALLIRINALETANADARKAATAAQREADTAQRKANAGIENAVAKMGQLRAANEALTRGPDAAEYYTKVTEKLMKYVEALRKAGVNQEVINALEGEYQRLLEENHQMTDKFARAADQMAAAVTNGLEDIILTGKSVKDMLHDLAKELLRVALRAMFLDNIQAALGGFFKGGGFPSILSGAAGGAGGGGGLIPGGTSPMGGAPSFSTGGSFKLTGSGGSDTIPFFGLGKAGETVTVSRPDQQTVGGYGEVTQINNFNGSTMSPEVLIPLLEENNRKLKAELFDSFDRGSY